MQARMRASTDTSCWAYTPYAPCSVSYEIALYICSQTHPGHSNGLRVGMRPMLRILTVAVVLLPRCKVRGGGGTGRRGALVGVCERGLVRVGR